MLSGNFFIYEERDLQCPFMVLQQRSFMTCDFMIFKWFVSMALWKSHLKYTSILILRHRYYIYNIIFKSCTTVYSEGTPITEHHFINNKMYVAGCDIQVYTYNHFILLLKNDRDKQNVLLRLHLKRYFVLLFFRSHLKLKRSISQLHSKIILIFIYIYINYT